MSKCLFMLLFTLLAAVIEKMQNRFILQALCVKKLNVFSVAVWWFWQLL